MTESLAAAVSADNSAGAPTDVEIEEWAARERRRHEAWLRGPSETEKAIWAQRERERRAFAARGAAAEASATTRRSTRRQLQLATEGAISLVLSHTLRDAFDSLARRGREWEKRSNPPTNP